MDLRTGIFCIVVALLMVPATIVSLNNWDESEEEYKRGCDPVYRIYMGITTDVSEEECNQLKAEEVSNLRFFFLSLSIFVLTSISGLILILPNSDENPPGLL